MFTLFQIIFFSTIFLCTVSYFLYPSLIWLIGKIYPFKVRKAEIMPSVSVIIPAYNEEKNIEKKIKNTLELNYSMDKLEILVGSDGSQDETSNIVKKYETHAIRFFDFKNNRGKTAVQNDLVKFSVGEILVFTDAASFLSKNALNEIMRNFADERVGCVAGKLHFIGTDRNLTTQSQGIYWKYESNLRELESRLGKLIGVDGPLYAIRRDCYVPLANNVISDLMMPLYILGNGKKVILESKAHISEVPTTKTEQEFATRRRITLRGLVGIKSCISLLNPIKHPFLSLQIILHKIVRWFVGPLLILNFIACFVISDFWLFKIIFAIYLLFIIAAIVGWLAARNGIKVSLFAVPYYFIVVNLAATMGIFDFFMKKQTVTWKPVRN